MKLGELCLLFTDGDWIESKDQSDSGIRLIQTGNIGNGEFLYKNDKAKYISEDTFKRLNCTEVFPDDILISRLPEPVGRGCIIPDIGERMITAVDCTICRVNEKLIDRKYFCYFLESNTYKTQLEQHVTGTTRKRISRKNLSGVEIDIPEQAKQKEIVYKLDRVKKIIRNYNGELDLLDEAVRARFVEMFGNPVTNDMLWNIDVLKDICTKIGSGSTPRGGKESYIDEGISLIRSMNVHNAYFEYKDLAHITLDQAEKLNNVVVEYDDLLFNITGASVARCCVVPSDVLPARVNQHVCILRCREKINPIFLQGLLVNENYQGKLLQIAKSGATREAINKQQLESLEIMIPPLELQNQFASFVKEIDKSRSRIQKSLEASQELFDSLMQEYFG